MTCHCGHCQHVAHQDSWVETVEFNRKYDRDPRVVKARKQYRADLRAGMRETDAWDKANAVYSAVRLALLDHMEVERNG